MRTHVDFKSEKFPRYPGEVEGVNHETIWGKRLADYLAARLKERGFPVEEPFAEDWGWMVPIRNAAFPLWIGCANYGEERDHGFACFIEPSEPEVRRWFKKIDTRPAVTRLSDALDAILSNDPDIREVLWVE
jgi:hypothetical protein